MSAIPILRYADVDAAITFLTSVFGFTAGRVEREDDGSVEHAQLSFGDGVVMLGTRSDQPSSFDAPTPGVYVVVEDVDAHHDKVAAAGAKVVSGLADQPDGSREYAALDSEGNVWSFGTNQPQVLAGTATRKQDRLLELMFGFFPAQLLRTFADLGIAEALAAGALDIGSLASRTGTHPPSLRRLLTAAIGLRLVDLDGDHRYALTEAGELLGTGAAGSMANLARLFCGDTTWRSWGELPWSVRTGKPSFEKITGRTAFEHIAADPELASVFTEAMAEGTRAAAPGVVAICDLTGIHTLCDVGGGNGTLLAAFLTGHPALRGVLFDTADGLGDAADVLADVADRCEIVAGDFFVEVPRCDAYVVKSVVHDWNDDRAAALLARVRTAAPHDARLFLVEPVLPDDPASLRRVPVLLMSDLNMLVCTGGRERTRAEFQTLLGAAGWRLRGVETVPATGMSVLRAEPA